MPEQDPTFQQASSTPPRQPSTVSAAATAAYEPIEDDATWLQRDEELPRRPRRRFFTPPTLTLLGVLLIACGFIAGVLVEKGQGSSGASGASASSLASRLASLRGGSSQARSGAGASTAGGSAGAFGAGRGGGATTGQVAFISKGALYVTTAEGNTVKVTTSAASTVTKTVKASVKGIHPGETVVVTGTKGAGGAISAEAIRVGSSGAAGFSGLFGGSGAGASGSGAGGGASKGGEPALFGNGG